MLLRMPGVMVTAPAVVRKMVWPSGSDFATMSAPITPLAPALFSMMTGWPSESFILSAMSRPTRSVGPPGGNAITMRIGRDGKFCANVGPARAAIPSNANTARRWDRSMSPSKVVGCQFSVNRRGREQISAGAVGAVGRNRSIAPFLPRADPIDGSLFSKRRNKAIAPYGLNRDFLTQQDKISGLLNARAAGLLVL